MSKRPGTKREKPFATEVELCAAFIADVDQAKWTPFNETGGWDILLVRKLDGFQIGVHAKLKLNVEVVNQAIESGEAWHVDGSHPDCRAVLVPWDDAGRFGKICDYVGLTVIRAAPKTVGGAWARNRCFEPQLPDDPKNPYQCRHWHDMATVRRHKLPEYVPDVAAGRSAPVQLTDWKIKAIKIAVTLEMRGHLTRRDFAHHRVDHRRWIAGGWLKVEDGRFVAGRMPDFKRQHPVVYKQIAADAPKWLPKTLLGDSAAEDGRML